MVARGPKRTTVADQRTASTIMREGCSRRRSRLPECKPVVAATNVVLLVLLFGRERCARTMVAMSSGSGRQLHARLPKAGGGGLLGGGGAVRWVATRVTVAAVVVGVLIVMLLFNLRSVPFVHTYVQRHIGCLRTSASALGKQERNRRALRTE